MPIQNHVVLLQALAFLAFVVSAYSYCQRPGFICMNKGNCTFDKKCQCDKNWAGYDCRAPAKYVDCYKRCNNHGTCVLGTYCYCDFGWYGDNCEKQNETITCNMFSMDVAMRTPGKRVISLHGSDDCSLKLDKTEMAKNEFVYKRTFPMMASPGSPCEGYQREELGPGVFSYTLAMSVQRKHTTFAPLDWITEFTCTYERTANGSVTRNEEYKRFEVDIVDYLQYPLQNGAGTTQSKEFSLVFFSNLTDHEVLVVELVMYNAQTSLKMYDIIVDGCTTFNGKNLLFGDQFVADHLRQDGTRVSGTWVTLNPLNEAVELYFDYKVRVCKGQCSKPVCEVSRIPENRPGVRIVLQ
ncbi:EGF-like domain containing protein 1 [Ylistrum balloti]|uniref:EGF-like domain containing protein 1 n=1 Tax=Ylistrum balloti TaxID=509963 RepID=UPI002905E35C|nr:EGF-like domain containing protein 1 [Ylistrum balloti]